MPPPHRHKRGDSKKNDTHPVNTRTTVTYSTIAPTRNVVSSPGGIMSKKDRLTSVPPQAQTNAESLSSVSVSESPDPKSVSRSVDIMGPMGGASELPEPLAMPNAQHVNADNSSKDISKELESAKQQIAELNLRIKGMQQDMILQVASTPGHHERMLTAENKVKSLSRSLRDSQEKVHSAELEAQRCRAEIHRLRDEAAASIQSLTYDHSMKIAADEAHIRQLVDKVTRDKVEGRWGPLPDSDIRHRLTLLNNDMRDWSKQWAATDISLDKDLDKETVQYLRDFVRPERDGGLPVLIRKPPSKIEKRIPPLLLHAALAHEIHYAFFESPFFCTSIEHSTALDDLLDEMIKADPRSAHIWRAGLWRILNPPVPEGSSKVPPVLERSREQIKTYCETICRNFREGPASFLLAAFPENSPELQVRATRLRAILLQASVISTSLWTQHSAFETLDLRQIQKRGMAFDVSSRLMQGHPLSKVDVDDERFNGLEIVVVTRPALIAFDVDDSRGLEGDDYRVLAGAVVLLDGKY